MAKKFLVKFEKYCRLEGELHRWEAEEFKKKVFDY